MTAQLIETYRQAGSASVIQIHYDSIAREYRVRVLRHLECDYFTDCRIDAINTAAAIFTSAIAREKGAI